MSTQREAPSASRAVSVEVDGERFEREVEARKLLVHFLRDDLDKTGTHIGCDRATAVPAPSSWTASW